MASHHGEHPDLELLEQLEKDPDLQIIQVAGIRHYTASMLRTIFPCDNRDVALALEYAIKSRDLVDRELGGADRRANIEPCATASGSTA